MRIIIPSHDERPLKNLIKKANENRKSPFPHSYTSFIAVLIRNEYERYKSDPENYELPVKG